MTSEQPSIQDRRTVRMSYADGSAYSLMVGFGETYLPAFALAVGMGQVTAGLLSSLPLLVGGLLQLLTPYCTRWAGSYRRWVVLCASTQALSYLPLAVAALTGTIAPLALFVVAAMYWGAGMAAGPAWNNWIDIVIPRGVLTDFLANRSRVTQAASLAAFLSGGVLLQFGAASDRLLLAFAILFALAGGSRVASAIFLRLHADAPAPDAHEKSLKMIARRYADPQASRFLLFLLVSQVSVNIAAPFFTPYMLAHVKFSYWQYTALVSAAYLSKIAFYPWITRVVKRLGAYRTLWVAGLFIAPPPLFWFWTPDLLSLCLLQVLAGFAWGCFELASMLLIFHRIAPAERLHILTLNNLLNALAVVAGSLIGGAALKIFPEHAAYRYVFVASACLRVLSLGMLIRVASIKVRFKHLSLRTVGLRPGRGGMDQPVIVGLSDTPVSGAEK